MRMRTLVLGAAVGMGLAAGAQAASVTAAFKLTDMANVALPSSGGVYTINKGTQFKVVVQGQVISPNMTAASGHTDSTFDNVPLGIQNATYQILSGGVNIVTPDADSGFTPPRWMNLVKGTKAYSFVNLLDLGSDGDLDPSGAGVNNTSLNAADGNPVSQYQIGALGSLVNLEGGSFTAANVGSTTLTTNFTALNVYSQSASDPDALPAVDVKSSLQNPTITINVVDIPEPASLSFLGLGALGLIRRRR